MGEGRSAKTQGTQVIPVIEGALGRQQEAQFTFGFAIHLLHVLYKRSLPAPRNTLHGIQRTLNKNIFKAEWTISKMPWSS